MAHLDNRPKFTMTQFNATFNRLVMFFRAKITKDISEMYYHILKIYPVEAVIKAIDDHINSNKPTSANFPPPYDIANACGLWLNDHADIKHKITVYDPVEDDGYPLDMLFDGFRVLVKMGKPAFLQYAKDERMPRNDVQRVIDKWRYSNEPEYQKWVRETAKRVRINMKNFSNMEELPF